MSIFGQKMAALRKERKISQSVLAKKLNTSTSVIGRYERGEMIPSIEAAKKISELLDTTVGYLLDETEEANLLKDSVMLGRLNEISKFPEKDKNHILYTLDALIRNVKTRQAYT